MATLLENVARTRDQRRKSETAFRAALHAAKPSYSWAELGKVAGLSPMGVKHLVQAYETTKGENHA